MSHQLPPECGDTRVTAHTSYQGITSSSKLTQPERRVHQGGKRFAEREGKLKPYIFLWNYQNFLLQKEQVAQLKAAPFPKSCCVPKSAPALEMPGWPDHTERYWQTTEQSKGTSRAQCLQHQVRDEKDLKKITESNIKGYSELMTKP